MVSEDAETGPIEECATIEEANKRIVKLVSQVNELIDEEFSVQETLRTHSYLLDISRKYSASLNAFTAQLKKLREDYIQLNSRYRGNPRKAEELVRRLYYQLRREYEKHFPGQEAGIHVEVWDIPKEFKVPRPKEPRLPAPRSTLTINFYRKIFSAKNHYRARTHMTLSGARAHCTALEEVLRQQQAKHPEREKMLEQLEENMAIIQQDIDNKRFQLMERPPHNIWYDAYKIHAAYVSAMLVHIDCVERRDKLARPQRSSSVSTAPGATSYRRMSGPDINNARQVHTADRMNRRNDPRIQRNRRQVAFNIESFFRRPMNALQSNSAIDLTESQHATEEQHDSATEVSDSRSLSEPRNQNLLDPIPRPAVPLQEIESYHLSARENIMPRPAPQPISRTSASPKLSQLVYSQLGRADPDSSGSLDGSPDMDQFPSHFDPLQLHPNENDSIRASSSQLPERFDYSANAAAGSSQQRIRPLRIRNNSERQ